MLSEGRASRTPVAQGQVDLVAYSETCRQSSWKLPQTLQAGVLWRQLPWNPNPLRTSVSARVTAAGLPCPLGAQVCDLLGHVDNMAR